MKIYTYKDLSKQEVDDICNRALEDDAEIGLQVQQIISAVKAGGDEALRSYNIRFDKVATPSLLLNKEEIGSIAATTPLELRTAIETAARNIRNFHQPQYAKEAKIETMPGVTCWRESRAISRVGLYIPGGSAVLPSTFLMLAIPAQIAGCEQLVVCTPPGADGKVNAAVAYCAVLLGIDQLYLTGGAQAIAAMAYGTESIPKTDKIFGPGNRYVTTAKTILQKIVAIDMPAGPSEVLVIADDTANSSFIASDLLAQAEHGIDSQAILVSNSSKILTEVMVAINEQMALLPRNAIAEKALDNSFFVQTRSLAEAMEFSNIYAPEHLILATEKYNELIPSIINAGSVFLGNLTPESAGDYASGTNHTLPTSGFAKAYSGVSVDSFLKKITFQHITPEGLKNIGPTVELLAAAEGLEAHKNAISIRLKS